MWLLHCATTLEKNVKGMSEVALPQMSPSELVVAIGSLSLEWRPSQCHINK